MKRQLIVLSIAAASIALITVLASIAFIGPRGSHGKTTNNLASATPFPYEPALIVDGTQVTTANGINVTLVGTSHSSLEYSCTGDGHFARADFHAMRAWGMTVVRIPLWSRYWLNLGNSCPGYQATVADAVTNAVAEHLYVILDLQWIYPFPVPSSTDTSGNALYQYPMPDTGESVEFWQQVAQRFGINPNVLFDLYGEPNAVSWQSWYAGGAITTPQGTYQAIGMRDLISTVRAIAPHTVLIISGINWGYDLSEVGSTYTFPQKNLLFGTHPFDYSNKQPYDYSRAFGGLAAKNLAVIATEFGSYDCTTGYIGTSISYFNQHHIPWLAWNWSPYGCGTPSLLSNWNGTPSQPYGVFIQQAMLALHATTPESTQY